MSATAGARHGGKRQASGCPRSQTRPPASWTDQQPPANQAGVALHGQAPEQKPRPPAPQGPTDATPESAQPLKPQPGGLVRGPAPRTPRTPRRGLSEVSQQPSPGRLLPPQALTHGILGADPLRWSGLGPHIIPPSRSPAPQECLYAAFGVQVPEHSENKVGFIFASIPGQRPARRPEA